MFIGASAYNIKQTTKDLVDFCDDLWHVTGVDCFDVQKIKKYSFFFNENYYFLLFKYFLIISITP